MKISWSSLTSVNRQKSWAVVENSTMQQCMTALRDDGHGLSWNVSGNEHESSGVWVDMTSGKYAYTVLFLNQVGTDVVLFKDEVISTKDCFLLLEDLNIGVDFHDSFRRKSTPIIGSLFDGDLSSIKIGTQRDKASCVGLVNAGLIVVNNGYAFITDAGRAGAWQTWDR